MLFYLCDCYHPFCFIFSTVNIVQDNCCRLRMSPHNVAESSRVEMMAECPIDHPFFVKDKGEKDNYKQMIKSGNDDEMSRIKVK